MARKQTLPEFLFDPARACNGIDPEVFFPPTREYEHEAKMICAECPARAECLDWAIRTRESDGIWGGCNPKERRLAVRARWIAAQRGTS